MAKLWLVAATSGLILGALVLGWFQYVRGASGPFPGTTIGGFLPAANLAYTDWLDRESERRLGEPVLVSAQGECFEVTRGELGIDVDRAAMLVQAERQKDKGNLGARLARWVSAMRGSEELVWLASFDAAVAREALGDLARRIDVPAVDAKIDLDNHHWVDARAGTQVDIDATVEWLARHREVELDFLPLVLREVKPKVTMAELSPVDMRRNLSSFETDFRTRAGTRAVNIRVAAKALNGTILGPGEIFSFNRVVGRREESRGYREAPVIVDDVVEPGVGGGVCQVATTVHAAAVLAGLEVIERRSHSRPSGYAPLGLDATVIDGKVDLRFRNPYPVPILIATSFPERYRLRVELLGYSPGTRLEHQYGVKERFDYYRRVVTRSELAAGSFVRKQKGTFGYDVVSTVRPKGSGSSGAVRSYRSKYWPVPEVYWVGPGTDLHVLPPLPEGASGVQLDGVTVQGQIPKDVEERSSEAANQVDGAAES